MTLVWLIDDDVGNHGVAQATVAEVAGVAFAGFLTGPEAVAEARRLARATPSALPSVVLMDYYLGEHRGDQVTVDLLAACSPGPRPFVVGYSSMRSGSEAILRAGGNAIVPKRADRRGLNPWLWQFLTDHVRG